MISPALERDVRPRHRRRATPNASVLLSKGQLLAVLLILGAIAASSWYRPRLIVTVVVAACMAFYIVTALLKLVITLAGRNYRLPECQYPSRSTRCSSHIAACSGVCGAF